MNEARRDDTGVDLRRRSLLEKSLTTRFGLRLHMSLMLAAAFAVGFGSNFLMLRAGFTVLTLRWVVAYLVGYAVLFISMRCWLAYVGVRPFGGTGLGLDDGWSSGSGGGTSSGGGGGSSGGLASGGGRFGGGGASTSFNEAGSGNAPLFAAGANASSSTSASAATTAPSTASSTGTSSGSSSSTGGSAHSSRFSISGGDLVDGDGFKLLVLIAVVLALIFAFGGGIVFMIATAPHLLVDVAFGAAITSGVAPAARRAGTVPAWQGSVWHATWKPVAAVLVVLVICGLVFSHYFPGISTLGDAWTLLHAPKG